MPEGMSDVMDQRVALRILGLSESFDEFQARQAYWALRAHVQRRADLAGDANLRARRAAELRALDDALRQLVGAELAAGPGAAALRSGRGRRWLLAWAIAASVGCAVLGAAFLAVEPPPPEPAAPFDPPVALAELSARADLEGARLEVSLESGGAVVAEGPADGRVYRLEPGSYSLRVVHSECPDEWLREIVLSGGVRTDLAPRMCADTGWLVVRSNVSGDRLRIDDREVGGTGPARYALSAGGHPVGVQKDGYSTWQGVAEVRPGEVTTLRAELSREKRARPSVPEAARSAPGVRSSDNASQRAATRSWHDTVKQWLLARYDSDRSLLIDREEEISEISCDEWLGLERSLDSSGLVLPLRQLYGFDGEGWVSNALGVDTSVRDLANARMLECGLR